MSRKDDIETIREVAEELGWTAVRRIKGGYTLQAPGDAQAARIVLPAKGPVRQRIGQSWMRKILRYADPDKRIAFIRTLSDDAQQHVDWRQYFDGTTPAIRVPDESKAVVEVAVAPAELLDARHDDPDPSGLLIDFEPDGPSPAEGGAAPGTGIAPEPRILTERPFMAHRRAHLNGGDRYASQAVIERHWSDGTIDYACSKTGCDYTNMNSRAVASHYGASRDHDIAPQGVGMVKDLDYLAPLSKRRIDRVARMEARIEKAMIGLDPLDEDFQHQLAEAMIEDTPESGYAADA